MNRRSRCCATWRRRPSGSAAGRASHVPDVEFKIFQFPANKIPRIDGSKDDWSIVPESYAIGMDQLRETVTGIGDKRDPANLDVKVKVGWVNGQNHLYFLYEASDNYWDFAREDLHNDIFELVIDGDLSGGLADPPDASQQDAPRQAG